MKAPVLPEKTRLISGCFITINTLTFYSVVVVMGTAMFYSVNPGLKGGRVGATTLRKATLSITASSMLPLSITTFRTMTLNKTAKLILLTVATYFHAECRYAGYRYA